MNNTCPIEELLDYLLNPNEYAEIPEEIRQHSLTCRYCRGILNNPNVQEILICALTRNGVY